ncbi:MAG: recombinase family protein [Mesorhizobium sp.]|nr:MAG: recombinase family protein [Mesorhizobium sp.]
MKYGYARVSTEAQDLTAQIDRLQTAGCQRIFFEKQSGKDANRPQLKRLLRGLKAGDVVYAVVSDRVARDPFDLLSILRTVTAAGAGLRLLDEPFIDTTSEMSDLVLFLVGWAAKWQRRRILQNTANGRARAMAMGVNLGANRNCPCSNVSKRWHGWQPGRRKAQWPARSRLAAARFPDCRRNI